MKNIPDPNTVFSNEYGTTCFLKNVITAPNISVGDYTYYDSEDHPPSSLKRQTFSSITRFSERN